MLRALLEKVDNMREQVDNVNKYMEILKIKGEMLDFKNTIRKRMSLMGSLINWTWLRKESLTLRIRKQKLLKLKSEEKKDGKKWARIFKKCGKTTKSVMRILEGEEKE